MLRLHDQTTAVPVSTMVDYSHLLTPAATVLASARDPSNQDPDFADADKHNFPELNGMLLDTMHAEPLRTALGHPWDTNPPHHLMDEYFWDNPGVFAAPDDATVPVCTTCRNHLRRGTVPRTAIANHNFLGEVQSRL